MKKIIYLFLTLLIAIPIAAQPKPKIKKKDLSRKGLRKWELQIVENAYTFNASTKNRSELLHSLERYAELECFPKLHAELSYQANEISDTCNELVDKLLLQDPANPLAICIRDGFKAITCLDAFSNQNIVYANVEEHPKYFQNTYGTKPLDLLSNDKQSQDLAQSVFQSCKTSKTELVTPDGNKKEVDDLLKGAAIFQSLTKGENSEKTDNLEPKEDTFLKNFGNKDDPKKEPKALETLSRRRVLSSTCKSALSSLENLAPFHTFVPCYREGFYTPNCANQKAKWKAQRAATLEKLNKKKGKSSKSNQPFSTF